MDTTRHHVAAGRACATGGVRGLLDWLLHYRLSKYKNTHQSALESEEIVSRLAQIIQSAVEYKDYWQKYAHRVH